MLLAAGSVFRVTSAPEGSQVEFGGGKQITPIQLDKVVTMMEDAGARLVELTRQDGSPCFLSASAITVVRDDGQLEPGSKAVVFVAGQRQAVRQTKREVRQAVEGKTGPTV